jgi:hypothetical protein
MNARDEEIKNGTRREFLREAGAAAGGAAIIGTTTPVEAQDAQAPQPDDQKKPLHFRASAPLAIHARHLGNLADLPGTWVGKGFNLISLPDFHDGKPFRLQLNATVETLEFTPIGGKIPNRGSGQDDIFLFGVTYLQRVSDAKSNGALHIEPGLWLNVPGTTVPNKPAAIVRQGTIPHGDSLLATGPVIAPVPKPIFQPVDSTPTRNPAGPPLGDDYLAPFANPTLPEGFKPEYVKNLNLALADAIKAQEENVVSTVVLDISTANNGGILNIPFVTGNANATKLDAIFWIETVQLPDGSQFMQLQYTQTVILNFLGIDWPHISVATLVKQ